MRTTSFEFKFKHNGEKIEANCQVITLQKFIQYRVNLVAEDKSDVVFNFYRSLCNQSSLYWFPLSTSKQELAKSMAFALAK